MMLYNKYLVVVLTCLSLSVVSMQNNDEIKGYPGIVLNDTPKFEDQEITEIMFGEHLEHDEPLVSLERLCPTPPTPELNK